MVNVKAYKETEYGLLPEEWELVCLDYVSKEMADGPFGSNLKKEHYCEEKEVRLIQLSNIGEDGWKDENIKYTSFEHAKTIARCIVETGNIVVAKMMPAGRAIVCPSREKMYVLSSDAVKVVVDNTKIDTNYFMYATKSRIFQGQIDEETQGSTRARTSITKLKKNVIPLPPLPEQRRIAEALSEINALIPVLEKLIDKKRAIKQGAMQELLTGKRRLDGFNGEWVEKKVEDIVNVYDNLRVPIAANLRKAGRTPYYGANGVQDYIEGFTHDGEFVLLAEDGANDLANYPINYVSGEIWVNNHAHVIQGIIGTADTRFLSYAMKCVDFQSVLVGGTRAKLNAAVLRNIEVVIPKDIEEQTAITSILADMDAEIDTLTTKLDKLRNIKQGMMSELLTGRIRLLEEV